ncbi:MAG: 2-dehydropantoate 2-reductase [Bacteroidales bacterium]|nr:2-dehydropantoate 2-reductase [Bacteroidales bacterium]
MNIAIIGAGGVGGYFGGKLAASGANVTFVARGSHLEALKTHGLKVTSINGSFVLFPVHATDTIENIPQPDLVLVCTKAWQVKNVAKQLKYVLKENTIVLGLQNGILAADELSAEIGSKHVLCGLCRIFSKIEEPGHIVHSGVEPTIVFGEADNKQTQRVQQIKALFDLAGFQSKIAGDIQAELWKKFISICVSGLLAVTRSNYGQVREIAETRQMMVDLLNEGFALSQKAGISIEPGFVEKTVAFIDSFPYETTSSLTRDVWEGKPSEIEYQNGTMIKLGEKYGIGTPVNRFVYNCILPMETRARRQK